MKTKNRYDHFECIVGLCRACAFEDGYAACIEDNRSVKAGDTVRCIFRISQCDYECGDERKVLEVASDGAFVLEGVESPVNPDAWERVK